MNKITIKNLTKRQIRYLCFRLQTESDGGSKADPEEGGILEFVEEIKTHMEEQEDFGGWLKFAKTWDVDEKSPLVAVKRTSSIQTEWNKILKEETKVLPVIEENQKDKKQTEENSTKKLLTNKLAASVQDRRAKEGPVTPLHELEGKFSKGKSFWDKLR